MSRKVAADATQPAMPHLAAAQGRTVDSQATLYQSCSMDNYPGEYLSQPFNLLCAACPTPPTIKQAVFTSPGKASERPRKSYGGHGCFDHEGHAANRHYSLYLEQGRYRPTMDTRQNADLLTGHRWEQRPSFALPAQEFIARILKKGSLVMSRTWEAILKPS